LLQHRTDAQPLHRQGSVTAKTPQKPPPDGNPTATRLQPGSKFSSTFPKLTKRLLETVQNKDIETFNACVGVIHETRDGIQRRNSSVLKDRVLQWIPKIWHLKTKENEGEFPFPETGRVEKSSRGVENKIIALLLCPHKCMKDVFGKSSTARTKLLDELKNHDIVLVASGRPLFLYDTQQMRASNRWTGYLRGPLLEYALRAILKGPSAALGPKVVKTKKCNAELMGITKVTSEMIAYAALQVRFSLCSLQEFANVDGEFSFEDFFHNIVDSIAEGTLKSASWGQDLLEWWNLRVFPEVDTSQITSPDDTLNDDDPDAPPNPEMNDYIDSDEENTSSGGPSSSSEA
ncbi:hypothetical protein F5880DRAFT_1511185, partial [Lentinula raphanica]